MNYDKAAYTALTHLLNGHSLDDLADIDCGPWAECVQAIADTPVAERRRIFDQLAQTDPALTRLLASFTPQPETPPALAEIVDWLPMNRVLDAFYRGEAGDADLLAAMYADRLAYDHAEKRRY